MRRLLAWLLGFGLGVLAGGAVLYVNPLTSPDDRKLNTVDATQELRYALAGPGALAFTHGLPLELDVFPPSIETLFEAALAKTALAVFVAVDEGGAPTALTSRLSKLSPRTNPITEGIVVSDYWLVTVPGEGSYFIESESNLWPFLRDAVIDVGLFKQSWSDVREYRMTVGPTFGGTAIVTGASGVFVDAAGVAVDTLHVSGLNHLAELREPLEGALAIALVMAVDETGTTAALEPRPAVP